MFIVFFDLNNSFRGISGRYAKGLYYNGSNKGFYKETVGYESIRVSYDDCSIIVYPKTLF